MSHFRPTIWVILHNLCWWIKLFTHCYLCVGHFLLTELLVPVLADQSRVIFLSSAAHFLTKSLDLRTACILNEGAIGTSARFQNYANSKLCLLLYSKNFAQRVKGKLSYSTLIFILNNERFFFLNREGHTCL